MARLPPPDADALAHSERLQALLRDAIVAHGPMPFMRYMEQCLYAPGLGYYSAGSTKFGAAGDFVTAPELGRLFAQCMARALRPFLRRAGVDADMLELGAGSGAFAAAVLPALAAMGALPARYLILEPSADLRERQRERLHAALSADVFARVSWLDAPPDRAWRGVLFANEVIDALPATRFAVHGGEVHEECVGLDPAGRLMRIDRPADAALTAAVRTLERELAAAFPDGYRSERLPQLPAWLDAVAGALERGALLFVDYGYVRREYYRAERRDGTLMAHYRHHAHEDPLWLPGLNDLTASVDFTALAEAGRSAGFDLAAYAAQAPFLMAHGLQDAFEQAFAAAPDETARLGLAQEVRMLTLPDRMGERFGAMLFTRAMDADAASDVAAFDRRAQL